MNAIEQKIMSLLDGNPMAKSGIAYLMGIRLSTVSEQITQEENQLAAALGRLARPAQKGNKKAPKIEPSIKVAMNRKAQGSDAYVFFRTDQEKSLERDGKLSKPKEVSTDIKSAAKELGIELD